jgi:hypothetical protein
MCLSGFPCTFTSCSSSRMHALCAAVTTSFCPRHPALCPGQDGATATTGLLLHKLLEFHK